MRAIIAAALLVALGMTATPAQSGSARELAPDLLSTVRVYHTVGDQVESLLVTQAQADQMELAFLQGAGLPVPAPDGGGFVATEAMANPQPAWPAAGTFTVRETGFYSLGARCPTGTVDAPPETVAAYNQARGTSATELDVWETSISEAWEKVNPDGTRSMYGSSLVHQPVDGSASTTYRYGRDGPVVQEGWTLQFAFEAANAPGGSFFCREETLAANGVDRVRLTGQFFPFGDRTDD